MRSALPAALSIAACIAACSKPSGTLDGIRYEIDVDGYSLIERNEREHVWVPSDDDDPILALRVSGVPTPEGEQPRCSPSRPGSITWGTGFVIDSEGQLRNGSSVGVGLCSRARPEVGVHCSAYPVECEVDNEDHALKRRLDAACRAVRVY